MRSTEKAAADAPPFDAKKLDRDPLFIPEDAWELVEQLPRDRFLKWWGGWRFCKRFVVEERDGLPRRGEPVYLNCAFAGNQIRAMAKEIRLVATGFGR